jgi:hypothetical protein
MPRYAPEVGVLPCEVRELGFDVRTGKDREGQRSCDAKGIGRPSGRRPPGQSFANVAFEAPSAAVDLARVAAVTREGLKNCRRPTVMHRPDFLGQTGASVDRK